MSGINKCIFSSVRLVKDAELKQGKSGGSVCRFSIAQEIVWNNSAGEKQSHTNFFQCVLFGKLGEALVRYLVKGKLVDIEAKAKQVRYPDPATGAPISYVEFVVDHVNLCYEGGVRRGGDAPEDHSGYPENGAPEYYGEPDPNGPPIQPQGYTPYTGPYQGGAGEYPPAQSAHPAAANVPPQYRDDQYQPPPTAKRG